MDYIPYIPYIVFFFYEKEGSNRPKNLVDTQPTPCRIFTFVTTKNPVCVTARIYIPPMRPVAHALGCTKAYLSESI